MLPIPWFHSVADFGSVWRWSTPHFMVTVTSDGKSYYWRVADLTAGRERPLLDGQGATFGQAEAGIREAIGKSYSPKLGYGKYAGSYATTFMLADGSKKDLGVYDGMKVVVDVINSQGEVRTLSGVARISHYELLVIQGEITFRIYPSHITRIQADGQLPPKDDGYQGKTRTMEGQVIPGCTGRAGFLAGTVDHVGRKCPIHE